MYHQLEMSLIKTRLQSYSPKSEFTNIYKVKGNFIKIYKSFFSNLFSQLNKSPVNPKK